MNCINSITTQSSVFTLWHDLPHYKLLAWLSTVSDLLDLAGKEKTVLIGSHIQGVEAKQQLVSVNISHFKIKTLNNINASSPCVVVFFPHSFQSGDMILLIFDERYENYVALSTGPTLFFLHPDSMAGLDLATSEYWAGWSFWPLA